MTAKTQGQRVAEHQARLRKKGLKQIRSLWAYPEDHAAIRAEARKLTRKREKEKAK